MSTVFQWLDQTPPQEVPAKAFRLYAPPPTRNALYERVLEEFKNQASELFAQRAVHSQDYYFVSPAANSPALFTLAASASASPASIVTGLPSVFAGTAAVEVKSDPPIFALAGSAAGCNLTIDLAAKPDADAIKAAYSQFLSLLESLTGSALLPGAARLIKSRIAERLPSLPARCCTSITAWTSKTTRSISTPACGCGWTSKTTSSPIRPMPPLSMAMSAAAPPTTRFDLQFRPSRVSARL